MNQLLVRALGATLFLSAFLLFWCQPMVGKMVLPYLGGAAAVWTTCVLFFQAILLFGYMYAHLLGRIAGIRTQILIHAVLLFIPFAFLPISFTGGMGANAFVNPAASLLLKLLSSVGIPFFVISTTAPLLQNWLSHTRDAAAKDPYFLYAASNAGSLLALLVFPFLFEPQIGVASQSRVWTIGYVVLAGMITISAGLIWRRAENGNRAMAEDEDSFMPPPDLRTRIWWIVPAFVASALMLAVTNHITANLAAAPFLWILPLALYLLTFIVAFSQRMMASPDRVSRLIPIALLLMFPMVCTDVIAPPGLNWIVIGLHLILLYASALLCHRRLAESRPDSRYLTEFYFWVALGGVLGGVFTATISPAVFPTVLEYPLLIAAVAFLRTAPDGSYKTSDADWNYPAVVAVVVTIVWIVFRQTNIDSNNTVLALVHTSFVIVAYAFRTRPVRFALTLMVLMIAYYIALPQYREGAERVYVARDFFGVKKVLKNGVFLSLLHGDTTHGIENTEKPGEPLSYYHPQGTMGDIMLHMGRPIDRIGVIGLGTGTMAGYIAPGRRISFYDIDPQVEHIAREYFGYLKKCQNDCEVIIGDGRLELQRTPDGTFDMLMIDAFSSDAIPAHLLSREALDLYLKKIAPDGVLLFHVSNRYLDVQRLVEQLLLEAGLVGFQRTDEAGSLSEEGKSGTNHVIAARKIEDLADLPMLVGWRQVTEPPGIRVWTDDYSSLVELIRWH